MTLKYILLGRPGNKEEFLHYIKEKGFPGVEIIMGVKPQKYHGNLRLEKYFPILRADRTKLELRNLSREYRTSNSQGRNSERLRAVHSLVFDSMLDLASYFEKNGFQATINGKPIEEAKRMYGHFSQ